jgi:small subunit ribosomal protein S21
LGAKTPYLPRRIDAEDDFFYHGVLRGAVRDNTFFKPRRSGTSMVKLTVRERESIQEAVRRFRKLVERSGIKKEMRRREFFEKPSETKRRARLRAERRTKRNRLLGV